MTTNLLATVVITLVTNVTERVPMEPHMVPCPEGRIGCAVIHWGPDTPVLNPTNKWVRTTIIERREMRMWTGLGVRTVTQSERKLSDVEVTYLAERTWSPVVTNEVADPPPMRFSVIPGSNVIIITNVFETNYWFLTNGPTAQWTLTNYVITNKP